MTPLSRACASPYSITVSEIFSIKYWRDLEIWVTGYSRSLKMVPFESLDKVYYSHSIESMAVSCIVSKI